MKYSGKYCNKCGKELKTIMRSGSNKFFYCYNELCGYFALLQVPKKRVEKQAISISEIK